jgi:hypothetical protein
MKQYLLKLTLLFSPIICIVGLYIIKDPFKVLYHYDNYLEPGFPVHAQYNKDYISTQNFINKYDKHHYDSYIFGNSRSRYYAIAEWSKHVSGTFYHFDASAESLYGIQKKFTLLEQKGAHIKNALFVIDASVLSVIDNTKDVALIKHPILSGQSKLDFELYFFKSFADINFLKQYIKYMVTKKYEPAMTEVLVQTIQAYDATDNEETYTLLESAIARNADSFYAARRARFYKRSDTLQTGKPVLEPVRIGILNYIKGVLTKNNTNYRIVINPLYDQVRFNPTDLATLKNIFGSENVYDFSGINDITSNERNYFEESHYRPHIASRIIDSIYRNKP